MSATILTLSGCVIALFIVVGMLSSDIRRLDKQMVDLSDYLISKQELDLSFIRRMYDNLKAEIENGEA